MVKIIEQWRVGPALARELPEEVCDWFRTA